MLNHSQIWLLDLHAIYNFISILLTQSKTFNIKTIWFSSFSAISFNFRIQNQAPFLNNVEKKNEVSDACQNISLKQILFFQ